MAQRVNRGVIIATISNTFIDLYRASAAKASGRTIGNMMSDFGYTRDFVVKNAFRDCSKMSQKKLRGCIQILRDTAVMLNSTGADERVALEQAIAKMLVLK
jgi:DNA polymerase-3 subunit delta